MRIFFLRLLRAFLGLLLIVGVGIASARPVYAMKNRTIVLRATGSGAALGLGAGLLSYPFAKSTNTLVAGAVVGALLGVIYGYHLVGVRDAHFQNQETANLEGVERELLRQTADFERQVVLSGRGASTKFVPVSVSFRAFEF